MTYKWLLALAMLPVLAAPALAADAPNFTDKQKAEIEEIIKTYLTQKNPGVILDAAREAQRKQEEEANKSAQEAIGKYKDKLVNDSTDYVGGNVKGDVTVVEFFDYNCGYCKKVHDSVTKLIADDKNVRFVYKEYPILSPSSTTASKAALAAIKQKKYMELHTALMENHAPLTDASIMEMAKKAGLDTDKLKKDMDSPEIAKKLEDDQKLGRDINARGTPTFVIGDKLVPGAMELDDLKKMVAEVRSAAPAKK